MALWRPQAVEQRRGRIAVRRPAELLLAGADRLARIGADDAIHRARIVSAGGQLPLQLDALRAAQRNILQRPGADYPAAALEAVGEQADGQGIGTGVVVLEDGAEVVQLLPLTEN